MRLKTQICCSAPLSKPVHWGLQSQRSIANQSSSCDSPFQLLECLFLGTCHHSQTQHGITTILHAKPPFFAQPKRPSAPSSLILFAHQSSNMFADHPYFSEMPSKPLSHQKRIFGTRICPNQADSQGKHTQIAPREH